LKNHSPSPFCQSHFQPSPSLTPEESVENTLIY
jgi:hypothetical protein